MMKTRILVSLGVGLALVAGVVTAQTNNGQICLSAFEDTNGNQVKDQGEAPITQDIVVTLADSQNIIVQSLLMDDSSLASNGVVCFQGLAVGQYTLTAASANYDATTTTSFLTAVDSSGNVQRFDYGGKLAISRPTASTTGTPGVITPERQALLLDRLIRSSLGALVAVSVLGLLGVIVYWTGFRLPPRSRVMRSTGQYPAVGYATPMPGQYTPNTPMRPVDPATGQLRNAPLPPVAVPPPSFDDTGPIRTRSTGTQTDLSGSPQSPASDVPFDLPDESLPPLSDDDTGRYRPPRE
jgi:hypothetical protein